MNPSALHVTANSKEVKPGSIFFAIKGARHDGHHFIGEAIQAGAKEIYCEYEPQLTPEQKAKCKIHVLGSQTRKKLGEFASAMMNNPTHSLTLVGVTGTSGKTTTTYLIDHLLNANGFLSARIGTNGIFFQDTFLPTDNTTPDALTLQRCFAELKSKGATHVVMEVSSHALHQDRPWGIAWDAALFLNLSREHMDYHPTLEDYFMAKSLLFTTHADSSKAAGKKFISYANMDQPFGKRLCKLQPEVKAFSPSLQVRNLKNTVTGIEAEVFIEQKWTPIECPLFGTFQIENIIAALSVAVGLGLDTEKACAALRTFPGVPGRMEPVPNQKRIFIFVDYAHKPEALEKVLLAIKPASLPKLSTQRLITVFGCGGDRDKTKRPVMGEIATRLSDWVIITSDNPRTEDPEVILKAVESGVCKQNYEVIPDRALAIEHAIGIAKPGDLIIIAGKGHEHYQIIKDEHAPDGTRKIHFDDREQAKKSVNQK